MTLKESFRRRQFGARMASGFIVIVSILFAPFSAAGNLPGQPIYNGGGKLVGWSFFKASDPLEKAAQMAGSSMKDGIFSIAGHAGSFGEEELQALFGYLKAQGIDFNKVHLSSCFAGKPGGLASRVAPKIGKPIVSPTGRVDGPLFRKMISPDIDPNAILHTISTPEGVQVRMGIGGVGSDLERNAAGRPVNFRAGHRGAIGKAAPLEIPFTPSPEAVITEEMAIQRWRAGRSALEAAARRQLATLAEERIQAEAIAGRAPPPNRAWHDQVARAGAQRSALAAQPCLDVAGKVVRGAGALSIPAGVGDAAGFVTDWRYGDPWGSNAERFRAHLTNDQPFGARHFWQASYFVSDVVGAVIAAPYQLIKASNDSLYEHTGQHLMPSPMN